MKKFFLTLGLTLITLSMFSQNSIYDFTVKDINGHKFPLSQLKGKKVMIINVASKCGFTPQYKQLEELYKKYKDDGFVIVGFPANNFKHQEPGNNEEIKKFCTMNYPRRRAAGYQKEIINRPKGRGINPLSASGGLNYGVSFPMMSKISVKGSDKAPLYKWLTEKQLNGKSNSVVKWNFQKYLIGRDGKIDYVINPWVRPDNKKIVNWITSN